MVMLESRKKNMDQFAITRAAAWAWYERGSLLEHNLIRESDFARKRDYTPRPSRYKLEAMKKQQKETHVAPSWSTRVEHHRRKSIDGRDHGGRRTVSKETKIKIKSKTHNGFWMRHGVVCGSSSDDVVEHAGLLPARRRQIKEKRMS
ncbi:hypothetical protein CTI12_AA086980 [Artemisia annua]|uniref:Uncharacterized protein n=1 Tax=Artemisia annua TaxID=35608 RepID=A0A2U1Q1E9_ARTAN|nr:hypothetical protein CTI12_AA086980 [Artemisia annua]